MYNISTSLVKIPMKIRKISKIEQKDVVPPMPHGFNISKNPIVLEILGNQNWYSKYLTSQNIYQNIYQEAGMKENLMGGLMGALILVLSGFSPSNASKETNVPVEDIEVAMSDQSQLEYARNLMDSMEKQEATKPKTSTRDSFLDEAFQYIGNHEGTRLEIYNDSEGIPTIGIGHKIMPGEDFSEGIDRNEAKELFHQDVNERLSTAKRLFPAFDTYPDSVKTALLDGVYRGDHKSSYRTTKLINAGRWIEASKEYLVNADYFKSQKKGTGVASRMEDNARRMYEYGKQLGQTT